MQGYFTCGIAAMEQCHLLDLTTLETTPSNRKKSDEPSLSVHRSLFFSCEFLFSFKESEHEHESDCSPILLCFGLFISLHLIFSM